MQYEVEVKCLLSREQAQSLPGKIRGMGLTLKQSAHYRQLNDYFTGGDIMVLASNLQYLLGEGKTDELRAIANDYDVFSVRARQNDAVVLIIVKATNGGSANHSTRRREFEAVVNISLDELHNIITSSGYTVQARWSADRTLYKLSNGMTLDSYFSPGYGHQAEIERIVHRKEDTARAETEVRDFAHQLGLESVDPARIERMFDCYNLHWREYYNTDKTFHVG